MKKALEQQIKFGADPELATVIDVMKNQLLIVLLNRLGGKADIPVAEIDGTGQFIVYMDVSDHSSFVFTVKKKE